MKTVYIPKGETVHYESLATEHLVVHLPRVVHTLSPVNLTS